MNSKFNKIFSSLVGTAMLMSAVPLSNFMASADASVEKEAEVVYKTDFEDGDTSKFSKRGDTDTSVIGISTSDSVSGSNSLSITERSNGWNGPSIAISDWLEPGVTYTLSASVKAAWYNSVKFSMQYTDSSGTTHYSNLQSVTSQGDWQKFNNVKFSYSADWKDVSIYFECDDKADLFVDDFEIDTATVYGIEEKLPSLKNVYSKYFKIGTAVTTDEISPITTQKLVKKHFNSITLGNELKPDAILDQAACKAMAENGDDTNPQVNIASAKTILNFARDNNISVRGHVLVWHSQTPTWFFKENYDASGAWASKDVMLKRMENYIKNVFAAVTKEYPTVDFYAWDVVNEAWLDNGSYRPAGSQEEGSNNSPWVKIFGDNSFIEPAFTFAKKYAPEGCKLYYNDFNEYMPSKTDKIVEMVTSLKEKGLIDGIGLQSHLDVSFPGINAYESAVKKFAATGLDLEVTELDVTTSDLSEAGFEKQAQYYSDIMDILVKYSDNISDVTFWGTTDDRSWRSSRSPLLFNGDYTAKPAFYSIVDGLDVEEPSETTTTTTTQITTTTTTTTTTSEPVVTTTTTSQEPEVTTTEKEPITTTTTTTTEKETPSDLPAASMYGDVNNDGSIDVSDVVLLNKYLVGADEVTKQGLANAQCFKDSTLDSKDSAAILKVCSGESKISDLPLSEV